jgi:hypothetical protein
MERTISEQHALEKVVSNLVEAVKKQEVRVGYLFVPHYGNKNEKHNENKN